MIGKIFGRLTVARFSHKDERNRKFWECVCECSVVKVIGESGLKRGTTRSCGCFQRESISKRRFIHGGRHGKLYNVWCHMKTRCLCPTDPAYYNYGERGITVCESWLHDFGKFRDDMGLPPFKNATVERIDNDKGYGPDNCRWATRKEQNRNTRKNVYLTHDGLTLCHGEWAEIKGMSTTLLWKRLNKLGWSIDKTLSTPVRKMKARS